MDAISFSRTLNRQHKYLLITFMASLLSYVLEKCTLISKEAVLNRPKGYILYNVPHIPSTENDIVDVNMRN